MKSFSERNQLIVGAIGLALIAALVLGALNYDKLPLLDRGKNYSAFFAEAGGLRNGAAVQVSGMRVGHVTAVELDGQRVLVKFKIDDGVRIGERSEAAVKTKSLLGTKILEVS